MVRDDTAVDVVVQTGEHGSPASVAERAHEAETLGFEYVSMGEATGWNVAPVLTVIAERTESIGIANDVFSPWGRSPALLAQTALTLHEVSGGRYRMGLGPSSPAITERWHGFAFERPLRRVREAIDIVRQVYTEGKLAYEGELFDVPDGLGYDRSLPEEPPRIDLATLGPKATEMTGRFANGWVPQLFTVEGLEERLSDLHRGAELGGRDPGDLRVSPIVRTFASEDRERAREGARSMVAFLVGAYGPFYGKSVAEQGFEGAVADIRTAWEDRDTGAMSAACPDELLDAVAACGTPEEVRERARTFLDVEGVDAYRLGFVSGMSEEEKRLTMETVAGL
jgi:coenzyme F420-dependent oxidoreductase